MIDITDEILQFPIMYDYQIQNRKRLRDANWDKLFMNNLIKKKEYSHFLIIRRIGRDWITAVLINEINYVIKLIKLPINQLYSYSPNELEMLRELKGKRLNIKEFKYNFKYYYAEINLNGNKGKLIDLPYCDVCFEENLKTNEVGYFNCSHKSLCFKCYFNLKQKICPFCRSI